jgi:hypothetical protein
MLTALLLAASLMSQYRPSWYALGASTVSSSADHETVSVIGAYGTFHAVKLTVQRSKVEFIRVVLHFANGDRREVKLRILVPAGGESPSIHLKGDERAIRRVEFWYDGSSVSERGAVIQLLGRTYP